MLKKKSSPKIDQAVAESVSFEVTVADLAKRSEKRAWIVAICSLAVSVMLGGTIYYMMPMKEKVPYLILADAYSGTSSLSRLSDDVVNRQITSSEAVNRSNVAHFVLAREAYDLALTNLRDWPTVLTMAAPDVAQSYMNLHAANNEQSPYKIYGKSRAIRVKILSISLIGGENGQTPKGATVRFQRNVFDKVNGSTYPLDNKIATISFTYKPNLRMDDQNRIENPLGFQVTGYRVDNDYGSLPPAESTDPNAPVNPAAANPAVAVPVQGAVGAPATGTPTPGAPVQQTVAPGGYAPQAPAAAPGQAPQAQAIPLQQSVGIPPSPIPSEGAYATQPQVAAPAAPYPQAASPAARPVTRAANGGRR
ncbi:MAG TPA: type IV secretion system protein [Luteibacter sp.]|uniref:virB8 family protein n=1 Tax=Luteibacter sp. TaxID=1886636 RepID=UPI002BC351A3|nr:type IV secretion system protein [Luteibacter sp.]HVI55568.1 type IV secretion system protein [Luteibacter sp.]